MQERRKLARSIGLKKATAHAAGSTAVAGSPRRLDTSKLNRYAAVRKKRKPTAVVGEATTASAATTTGGLPSETGGGKPVAAAVARVGQLAETAPVTAVGSAADAALLELAAEVEAAEGSQVEGLSKPKWDVVDVDLGGVIEAAQNAQKERLSSLLNNGPSSQAAAVHSGPNAAGGGTLTCNGVAMVASPAGADVKNQTPASAVAGSDGGGCGAAATANSKQSGEGETGGGDDDDWEYDYYAVVNPGASSEPGTDLDLGWMGAVEMDATGGADTPDSQTIDPVRALPIRLPTSCLKPISIAMAIVWM
eukprot:COSAG02_NODE_3981_length_5956_cov_16.732798_4_plen_307_part_00